MFSVRMSLSFEYCGEGLTQFATKLCSNNKLIILIFLQVCYMCIVLEDTLWFRWVPPTLAEKHGVDILHISMPMSTFTIYCIIQHTHTFTYIYIYTCTHLSSRYINYTYIKPIYVIQYNDDSNNLASHTHIYMYIYIHTVANDIPCSLYLMILHIICTVYTVYTVDTVYPFIPYYIYTHSSLTICMYTHLYIAIQHIF